jgi:hypothetical protein
VKEPTVTDRLTDQQLDDRARRAREAAARNVPNNPHPLCRDFVEQPEPSEFWCGRCHWNRPMHDDEIEREAIAAELERFAAACPSA